MSLYANYIKERENAHMIEKDWGFAIYSFGDHHVYLQDIYVTPDKRQDGKGVELMNEVAEVAKAQNKTWMIGSVDPRTDFAHDMYQIMVKLGFRLASSGQNIVYLKKEI